MAKLSGVKTLSDREIEYGGELYVMAEGPAQLGDIVRCDVRLTDVTVGAYYPVEVERDGVVGFSDDVGELEGLNGYLDYDISIWVSKFPVFRRAENTPQSPAEIRALIDKKRAEIADLETLIAPSVDDFVRVVDGHDTDEFEPGEIAKVSRVDKSDDSLPYEIDGIFTDKSEWVSADAVEKLTPAEAKAALIAQIEEMFQSA